MTINTAVLNIMNQTDKLVTIAGFLTALMIVQLALTCITLKKINKILKNIQEKDEER